jgi:hypothetical protein
MIAQVVYMLCGITSATCALLLLRGYAKSRSNLLLSSGLCFALLAVSNVILFIDLVLTPPTLDLSVLRNSITALAHIVLVLGLTSKS